MIEKDSLYSSIINIKYFINLLDKDFVNHLI